MERDTQPGKYEVLWTSLRPYLIPIATVCFFAIALWFLYHEFSTLNVHDVAASFRSLPLTAVLLSLAFTVLNYLVLIGYDWLGTRFVDRPLTLKQIATGAVLSYSFANALGAVLGGTPVRARLYTAWGLTAPEIARLIVVISITFWIGLFALGGVLFIVTPFRLPERFHIPLSSSVPIGVVLVSLVAIYLCASMFRNALGLRFGTIFKPLPLRIAVAQIVISTTDFMCASAALYVLLPADLHVNYFAFTAIFLLAILVGLITHVPGGLGILELVIVTMLPPSEHPLVASLLAYRIIYYVLPLLLAVIAVSMVSFREPVKHVGRVARTTLSWAGLVGPRLITGAIFVAGLILLVSGSLPAAQGRMEIVRRILPLPIVEVSHFLGSLTGAMLLILARGLQRRIDAAWSLTMAMLAIGAVVSLVKGFDYEEATILVILLVALLPCRKYFYRRGRLFAQTLSLGWIASLVMAIGLVSWLILFSYRHVEYSNELWWAFAFQQDAPRSLRGLFGAIAVIGLVSFSRLLQPHASLPAVLKSDELDEVAAIVERSPTTSSNLALLGDKRFLFSDDRQAFVMFGREGRSWIAMGDPVGPKNSANDAAWRFREACDEAGAWPVFYQIDESSLGRYIEMGLSMLKLGEEARVRLDNFSVDGGSKKDLRRTLKRSEESGLSFDIIPKSETSAYMPKFKQISDAWLGEKSAGEKGFSLGFFDESYLSRYDIAVVRQSQEIIAFANVWPGADKHELSIDLMRHVPGSPNGVMEYLFVKLMLSGREQQYEWFSLGMAPLSGVEPHRLGPWWNRVSGLVYRHGEHFYNFRGLRNYKQKFDPVWTPKYLASPGGIQLPIVLGNLATLISGGIVKLVRK